MEQVSVAETKKLLALAKSALDARVEGDFVEFGCYKGETSVLLGKLLKSSEKSLYLYDSFEGLPEKTPEDFSPAGANFKQGELLVTKREVLEKLRHAGLDLRKIKIKKAFFEHLNPTTDLPRTIAFAFLDGDLYASINTSLALVVPKLAAQGIIVVHDYNNPELPGASRAVDEFLAQNPAFSLHIYHTLAIITS
ncbi:class I SAM-dependent methyltransferase [Candidatus Saccharibacteria bacterium]|nr:class I SAM-dependent methyltransferase [Candidatus Saccharibacteria bacterium]